MKPLGIRPCSGLTKTDHRLRSNFVDELKDTLRCIGIGHLQDVSHHIITQMSKQLHNLTRGIQRGPTERFEPGNKDSRRSCGHGAKVGL